MTSGMTIKEMVIETNGRLQRIDDKIVRLDEKVDAVVVEHEKRLSNVEGKLVVYESDRKWALGIVGLLAAAMIATMSVTLQGCVERPPTPTVTPEPVPTYIADTPTPTADPPPAPEPPATNTPESTAPPTVDWGATPTQQTYTPSIVEVTPLGDGYKWNTPIPKIQSLDGWYVPNALQNVRLGPAIDYPVKYRIAAGQTVRVYAELLELPTEAWLCLDVAGACDEAVALVWNSIYMGTLDTNG